MCQFICCDSWWHNMCGIICGGYHIAYGCCSCWLRMPMEMRQIDPECCKIGCWQGCGYNHYWHGNVCCINQNLRAYSQVITLRDSGINTVVSTASTPHQPLVHMNRPIQNVVIY